MYFATLCLAFLVENLAWSRAQLQFTQSKLYESKHSSLLLSKLLSALSPGYTNTLSPEINTMLQCHNITLHCPQGLTLYYNVTILLNIVPREKHYIKLLQYYTILSLGKSSTLQYYTTLSPGINTTLECYNSTLRCP